jgi:glycosyltransferase involved in cell wall biosynthesis
MLKNKPELSFIIACYNAEKYLERTLRSIYEGSVFDASTIEVITINDGSSDGTLAELERLAKVYPIIVCDQENKGVGPTKNRGLELAQGNYVMILDADDWIDPQVIQQLLNFALEQESDILGFGMQYVNEQNEYTHLKNIFPGPFETILSGKDVLLGGYQPSSVCLFLLHKRFFKEEGMRFYNGTQLDVEISTRLMLKAKRVYFSKQIGYFYFRNEGSITKATSEKNIKRHLYDSVRIAILGKENIGKIKVKALQRVIIQNNNSIVWNLLWRFISKPKEVDYDFKIDCLKELKEKNLYPIKGPLKTNFQKISTLFFNCEWLLKLIFKLR